MLLSTSPLLSMGTMAVPVPAPKLRSSEARAACRQAVAANGSCAKCKQPGEKQTLRGNDGGVAKWRKALFSPIRRGARCVCGGGGSDEHQQTGIF